MRVNNQLMPLVYELSKNVHNGRIELKDAVNELSNNGQMERGTASDYINSFVAILKGVPPRRTINAFATRFLLENISNDYGTERLANSVIVFSEHLTTYERLKNTTMKTQRNILNEFQQIL